LLRRWKNFKVIVKDNCFLDSHSQIINKANTLLRIRHYQAAITIAITIIVRNNPED